MVRSTAPRALREFWSFYRGYTHTAIHAAATAALTIFGVLVFVDPWFAAIAIGCYVVPPVALYALGGDSFVAVGRDEEADAVDGGSSDLEASSTEPSRSRSDSGSRTRSSARVGDGDTDTDTDDGDTDSDSRGTDTDTDSDSDDGDTDTDRSN